MKTPSVCRNCPLAANKVVSWRPITEIFCLPLCRTPTETRLFTTPLQKISGPSSRSWSWCPTSTSPSRTTEALTCSTTPRSKETNCECAAVGSEKQRPFAHRVESDSKEERRISGIESTCDRSCKISLLRPHNENSVPSCRESSCDPRGPQQAKQHAHFSI